MTQLTPQTRILTGIALFATCMAAPVTRLPGIVCVSACTFAWLIGCRTPPKAIGNVVLLGLVFFLPALLLTPLIRNVPPGAAWSWSRSIAVPWSIFVRGMSVMLVSLGTVTTMSTSDLREGLAHLPIPRFVLAILLQIIQQAGTLVDETHQVACAMAVRGASGGGRTAWRVLSSLPQVWLPRVVVRAEDVAAAMEMRGYGQDTIRSFHRAPFRTGDIVVVALAFGLLGCAIALRWVGTA